MKFKLLAGVVLLQSALAYSQTTSYWETPEYLKSGALLAIGASSAYSRGYTGKGSNIAILDTGIDLKSTQFANRIVLTKDFTNSSIGIYS